MAAKDRFAGSAGDSARLGSPDWPATTAEVVVPGDSTDLVNVSRALWVGLGGDLTVIMQSGATVTFANVADGSLLPIRVTRVKSTGTTAASILGLD